MKVIILTEGSCNIGFGHITRCLSIAQIFEEKNIEILFFIDGDKTIKSILKDFKYKIFDWKENIHEIINLLKNNIVVIDSYKAEKKIYDIISEVAYKCLYLDDYNRIEYPKGFVLNSAISSYNLNYPKKENVTYLLGENYILLRKEFWKVPDKTIKENLESILITFGGNDIKNLTPKILSFLCKEYPNIKKNVIVGNAYKNLKEIKESSDKNTKLFFSPDIKAIINIMLDSDIAISAGGQTIYELLRIGVPTISICIAENQMENIKGFLQKNLISYIGRYDNIDLLKNLKEQIDIFKSYFFRLNRSNLSKDFINKNFSKNLVDLLWKIY